MENVQNTERVPLCEQFCLVSYFKSVSKPNPTSYIMLEKLRQTVNAASDALKEQATQLTDAVKEQATNLSDSVKEKAYALIEDWLKIFPSLENYGLFVTSFGINMSISPTLEVELRGEAEDFTVARLDQILEEVKDNTPMRTLFRTVRLTYDWHSRTSSEQHFDKIYLKVVVGISPQVMVYLGEPILM